MTIQEAVPQTRSIPWLSCITAVGLLITSLIVGGFGYAEYSREQSYLNSLSASKRTAVLSHQSAAQSGELIESIVVREDGLFFVKNKRPYSLHVKSERNGEIKVRLDDIWWFGGIARVIKPSDAEYPRVRARFTVHGDRL